MTDFILQTSCSKCVYKGICLDSNERNNGSHQKGTIDMGEGIPEVMTINLHQLTVPIVAGPRKAYLKLDCNPLSLNQMRTRNLKYAIGVPLKQEFAGDVVREYTWPTPMIPFYSSPKNRDKKLPTLSPIWNYEWILSDGTPYPISDQWTAEFFIVVRCNECNK